MASALRPRRPRGVRRRSPRRTLRAGDRLVHAALRAARQPARLAHARARADRRAARGAVRAPARERHATGSTGRRASPARRWIAGKLGIARRRGARVLGSRSPRSSPGGARRSSTSRGAWSPRVFDSEGVVVVRLHALRARPRACDRRDLAARGRRARRRVRRLLRGAALRRRVAAAAPHPARGDDLARPRHPSRRPCATRGCST